MALVSGSISASGCEPDFDIEHTRYAVELVLHVTTDDHVAALGRLDLQDEVVGVRAVTNDRYPTYHEPLPGTAQSTTNLGHLASLSRVTSRGRTLLGRPSTSSCSEYPPILRCTMSPVTGSCRVRHPSAGSSTRCVVTSQMEPSGDL